MRRCARGRVGRARAGLGIGSRHVRAAVALVTAMTRLGGETRARGSAFQARGGVDKVGKLAVARLMAARLVRATVAMVRLGFVVWVVQGAGFWPAWHQRVHLQRHGVASVWCRCGCGFSTTARALVERRDGES